MRNKVPDLIYYTYLNLYCFNFPDECCAHLELKIVDQTTLYFSKNFDQVNGRSTWIRDDDVSGNDNKKLIWFNDEYGRWVVGHIPTQEEFGLGGRISSGRYCICNRPNRKYRNF